MIYAHVIRTIGVPRVESKQINFIFDVNVSN